MRVDYEHFYPTHNLMITPLGIGANYAFRLCAESYFFFLRGYVAPTHTNIVHIVLERGPRPCY